MECLRVFDFDGDVAIVGANAPDDSVEVVEMRHDRRRVGREVREGRVDEFGMGDGKRATGWGDH